MSPNTVALILALAIVFTAISEQNAFRLLPCRRCITDTECEEDPPQTCNWGEGRDACGRRVCLKGPGEKCGGKYHIMGKCGDGMMCAYSDNRCRGCYIQTMDCYPKLVD